MGAVPDAARPAEPPPPHRARATRRAESLVIVNTGDGKGKTSAAMGVVVRAAARGWRVVVVQFVKSAKWQTGERKIAGQLGVEWVTAGDGFTWESGDLEESAALARHGWDVASRRLASGDYDLVVLEEITYPLNYGWLDVAAVVGAIRDRPPRTNVVATGRGAPSALVDVADTVTEMRKVKHAYDAGIKAKKGIEY